jgi:ATP-dependent helicase/DNAse subunit B
VPITLVTGPANAAKAEVVLDAMRRHLAHGDEPLLVVPTRADADLYTRELAGEGAVVGARVERFGGLIEQVVARGGAAGEALRGFAREAVLRALAARRGMDAGPGFLQALAELVAELETRRVTPARFAAALARVEDADAAALRELGSLYGDYRAALERLGRPDAELRAVRALDALRERPALWGATPVLLYGFDDLSPLQLDTVETLGRMAHVTVSLAYEPGRLAFAGRASSYQALAPLAAEHRELPAREEHYAPDSRAALAHLERSLFEPGARRVEAGDAVTLLEGGGERAELELVAREVGALLAGGLAPEEIALVARPGGVSLELLEEVFRRAGIPVAARRRVPLADTPAGRALLGLLRCVPAADGPAPGSLGDLLAWLRAPGLLRVPAMADSFELAARRRGAATATQARDLWEQLHHPLDVLDRLAQAQARGAAALLEAAGRELEWLFSAPRRALAPVLGADELPEAAAVSSGRGALAELRELARGGRELVPGSAAALADALAGVEALAGEPPASGAVALLDPLELRARRVRALFLCGLQEGVFPAGPRARGLLGDDERRRLAQAAGLLLGEAVDTLASERYLLYATLSRPRERLFLSWHLADDDGRVTPRSPFVDDVCDVFASALSERTVRRALGATDHVVGAAPTGIAPAAPRLRDEAVLAELGERAWSASSLERWIGCPVAWFVERVLAPRELDPEAEPLTGGGVAHAVLKDVLEGLRGETGSARVSPASLGRARELLAAALARHEQERPLSLLPERRMALRRRLQADLERFLEHAAGSPGDLEPEALELGFGFAADDERGEGASLPAVELSGGVSLRGRIDRVDVGEDGAAVVYDYKSSRAPASARWVIDGKLQMPLYMYAAERLLGVRAVGGLYQPLSGRDLRARGVLEAGAGVELDVVGTDVLEAADVRGLIDGAVRRAVAAAGEAARGELQRRPQTCAFRGGCQFPAICQCDC